MAGTSAWLPDGDRSRSAAAMRRAIPSATQSRAMATVEPVIPRRLWAFSVDEAAELPRHGKSPIRRSAIAPISVCARSPGNRAINEANLCVAVLVGSSDSFAASAQGSRFSRASAERTVSGGAFRSSQIAAYKKSLNAPSTKTIEAEGVIMITIDVRSREQ